MFLFRLAALNLFRNPRRALLSMVAVIAGVFVLILGRGFVNGLSENIIRAQVDSVSGHFVIQPADYPLGSLVHPIDALVTLDPEVASFLDKQAEAWTKRTYFVPTATYKGDSLRVRAIAYDPQKDESVFPRTMWKVDGKIPQASEDGVLVGYGVAKLLNIHPGDQIIMQARTSAGAINALSLPVAGVLRASNPYIDALGILMPDTLANTLIQIEGVSSHIAVRLSHRSKTEKMESEVEALLGEDYEVVTWVEETQALMDIQRIREKALNVLVFILLAMSAAGIANTILMAAYERIREIGTLRAMGMHRRDVLKLFIIEGAYIGTIGGLLGMALGVVVTGYYSTYGIDLTSLMEADQQANIPISAMLYLAFSWKLSILAGLFGVIVSVVASVYPARVASGMLPADAGTTEPQRSLSAGDSSSSDLDVLLLRRSRPGLTKRRPTFSCNRVAWW